MLIGYARSSIDKQNLDLQRAALSEAGCERIYTDTVSGSHVDRPGFSQAMDASRRGDTLVVWRLDKLARSLKDLIGICYALERAGMGLKSLQEAIDTTTSNDGLFFRLIRAVGEFQRNLNSVRTRAGIAAARKRGKLVGRPRSISDGDLNVAKALLTRDEVSVVEVARRLGVSASTIYRYIPGGRSGITKTTYP